MAVFLRNVPQFTSSLNIQIRRCTSSPRIYNNILETIGNTPIVRVNKIAPSNINLFVKCEFFNPLGSVKDRMAYSIIQAAEQDGSLKPGQTVIEATSGNTGIGLAMVCAQKGYPFIAVMAEYYSKERRKIMRALGAKVILTPAKDLGLGMGAKAAELAEANGWFLTSQFTNDANPDIHSNSTAPEILTSFMGKPLDYFVTGWGTGGTFTGTAKVLKAARPDLKVVLTEPVNAPLLASGIKQERDEVGNATNVHESFTFHPIQGWAPNFIPKIAEDGYNLGFADEIIHVTPEESIATAKSLAVNEGIFTGISGGATVASALKAAENAKDGSNVLAMLPDTMERYLSTVLFDDIGDDMNEEEKKLAATTPNFLMEN